MTQGPWMLGDNYLVIRDWVPNFIPEEHTITKLMVWVWIPRLSVEYFNKNFLLHKIGQKIGKVIRVDDTTANVERGQYTRMCIEVDLSKPLLSKFRLNGSVWIIQYEGLKMICFGCGKQGHKEDCCPLKPNDQCLRDSHQEPQGDVNSAQGSNQENHQEEGAMYGSCMIVKKPVRRKTTKQPNRPGNPTGGSTGM